MCGIIGYIGEKDAIPYLIKGLKKLEYRGYDSWGLATIFKGINIKKSTKKLSDYDIDPNEFEFKGTLGIAHTRWATHGNISENNAHPLTSCKDDIAIVHNGVIENYQEIKKELSCEGHIFKSDTDSEVIAHLIEKYYNKSKNIKKAIYATIGKIKGSFAFLAIFSNLNVIVAVRKDSPLVIGICEDGFFLSSDIISFSEYTDKVIFLDNLEIAIINKSSLKIFNYEAKEIKKNITQIATEFADISKKNFAHFTLKEIYEQSKIIINTFNQDNVKFENFCQLIKGNKKIFIIASGTSYHAALFTRYIFSKIPKIYCEAIIASEFNQIVDWIDNKTIVLAISQSGETADVLFAIREAKKHQATILSIVNIKGSSLDRESDFVIYLNCGPEIGVAATKSFTSQLSLIYLIAFKLAKKNSLINKLKMINKYIESILKSENKILQIAQRYQECNDFFFIGRSFHYPIALEGALKLKELSYIHAEGLAAGELKHGTLALVNERTPVIVINPLDNTYYDTLNNAIEMKTRGAKIIGISNINNNIYDNFIPLPKVKNILYPILEVLPLQLLAYHMARIRGVDVDYPRNLAKSVTVK